MGKIKDEIGNKYGKLTVLEKLDIRSRDTKWICKCDCGNEIIVPGKSLRSGNTKSCGCLTYKHGKTNSRIYNIYHHMKKRCNNYKDHRYKYYGGKGIKVCDEWEKDFNTFYEWAIKNGYDETKTIDRIDSNKNYTPENCQWITGSENATKMHERRRRIKRHGLPAGIYEYEKGYRVFDHSSGVTKYIGISKTLEEAKEMKGIA